jgi:GINS complex subunit 4
MGDRARPAGPDEKLMRAWVNERCAPVLLPYASDVVAIVQGRMQRLEQHLSEKTDDEQFQKWATYHALELDRIRFLLKSYLRCRLVKIQMHTFFICDNPDMMLRLSPPEAEFASSLREAYAGTMETGVLAALARPDLRDMESGEMRQALSEGPDVKRHVVVESDDAHDLGIILEQNRTLEAGVMTAVSFEHVMGLLETGQVRLV